MKSPKSQITTAKYNMWLRNKEHGDIDAIYTEKGISKHRIRKAFDFGVADQETADAIDSFFNERKSKVIA